MDDGRQCAAPLSRSIVCSFRTPPRSIASPRCPTLCALIQAICRFRDASEAIAEVNALTVLADAPKPAEGQFTGGSAYRSLVSRQGETLVPRMLCLVERRVAGRLGGDPTAPFIISRPEHWSKKRGLGNCFKAWSTELRQNFYVRCYLAKSILPYRVFRTFEGVVPVTADGALLDAQAAANRGFSGLNGWMSEAESIWNGHSPSTISLVQQFDYYGKLAVQFPLALMPRHLRRVWHHPCRHCIPSESRRPSLNMQSTGPVLVNE